MLNPRFFSVSVLIAALCSLSSCHSSFWPFSSNKEAEKNELGEAVTPDGKDSGSESRGLHGVKTVRDEIELRQAKIWNRLDEMDEQLNAQKEQLKILEQGLLTGVPPEALRAGGGQVKQRKMGRGAGSTSLPEVTLDGESEKKLISVNRMNKGEEPLGLHDSEIGNDTANVPDSYTVKLQVAKDYYQSGRFGLAIAELAQISKEFGMNAGKGEHLYWLGRSYLGLKEFATARTELDGFIKGKSDSALKPMARLELARCLEGLNLRERARKELSQIVRDYKGQEVSEMASMELKNLQGVL